MAAPQRPVPALQLITELKASVDAAHRNATELRRRVGELEARLALIDAGGKPRFPVKFRAQFHEDTYLWDLFEGKIDGFFIECGAFDGLSLSVSYAFEAVGWTGLLVEALPERARACAANRPGSRVVNAAIGGRDAKGEVEFIVTDDQWGGMLSYCNTTRHHLEAVERANVPRKKVSVPYTCFNELLKDHSGPIDFAVLDVEGGEVPLLEGFDLHRFKPRVLVIEENTWDVPVSPIQAYLRMQPYAEIGLIACNRIFVRADETALIDRARKLHA